MFKKIFFQNDIIERNQTISSHHLNSDDFQNANYDFNQNLTGALFLNLDISSVCDVTWSTGLNRNSQVTLVDLN